jgi:hypothetical protein
MIAAGNPPAGVLPSVHSAWGVRTTVSQSPVHHALAPLEGDLDDRGNSFMNVTLIRLRTPESAARHEKRQQRWLNMAAQLKTEPLLVHEQVWPHILADAPNS